MKFKFIFLIVPIWLLSLYCHSQEENKIDSLISNLSWKSITCDHMYHSFIVNYKDSIVQELIAIGYPSVNSLYNMIDVPEKTVIIHMILSKIMEPENCTDSLPIIYIYKNCNDLIGWHFIYNRLVWEWSDKTDYSIQISEIEKVKEYWNKRINQGLESTSDVDELGILKNDASYINKIRVDKILKRLEIEDKEKYPCKNDK